MCQCNMTMEIAPGIYYIAIHVSIPGYSVIEGYSYSVMYMSIYHVLSIKNKYYSHIYIYMYIYQYDTMFILPSITIKYVYRIAWDFP